MPKIAIHIMQFPTETCFKTLDHPGVPFHWANEEIQTQKQNKVGLVF